jgi:hypothetical protein
MVHRIRPRRRRGRYGHERCRTGGWIR